jgi:ADP-ribosylglycohydrolase
MRTSILALMAARTFASAAGRVERAFVGGLIGDALALGGHYEYDAVKIRSNGGFKSYSPPGEANNGVGWGTANYHPGKRAGDLTDSGEVAIMLLDHLVELKRGGALATYSFDSYAQHWQREIANGYGSCNFQSVGRDAKGCPPGLKPGYINGASRRTLQALAHNPTATGQARRALAAEVNCLIAATHFLPLFLVQADQEVLVRQAVDTVYISHRHADPLAAAEFLARALFLLTHSGADLEGALTAAAAATGNPQVAKWLADAQRKVAEALDPSSALSREEYVDDVAITTMSRLWDIGKTEPIKIGKASPTEGALPSALYFALKYRADFQGALIANAECGGDSAVRGFVIGMLLGASLDWVDENPQHEWLTGLNELKRVRAQMQELRGSSAAGSSGSSAEL